MVRKLQAAGKTAAIVAVEVGVAMAMWHLASPLVISAAVLLCIMVIMLHLL